MNTPLTIGPAQTETLLAFIETISSQLELRPLLDNILVHATRLMGADDGAIGLVDPSGSHVRIESACCVSPDVVGRVLPRGVGLAGRVLELDQVVRTDHYSQLPHPIIDRDNAVVGMPIRWNGKMIGVFSVGRLPKAGRLHPFTDADVEALGVFARHAAIAIENAKRYLREHERGERLQLIAKVGTLIAANPRREGTLQAAAEYIHRLLGYQNVGIGIVQEGSPPSIVINAMAGEFQHKIARPFVLEAGAGIMSACVRERRPIRVDDAAADPRYVPPPGVQGIKCSVSIPILVEGEVLGVLNVESHDPFDDEDTWSLQIVADQLAVALQNMRLYEQVTQGAALEERRRIARDLHDSVTQHLFGTVMLAESLGSVWERDPAQGKERVTRLLELSRAALGEMRGLLAEMHSTTRAPQQENAPRFGIQRVRAYGLPEALRRLARDVRASGLPVECSFDGYTEREFVVEEALYRIVQEALHNAVKHAGATHACVGLTVEESTVRLVVEDDGCGLGDQPEVHDPIAGCGLGIDSMKARAKAVGADLALTDVPNGGLRVEVTVRTPVHA